MSIRMNNVCYPKVFYVVQDNDGVWLTENPSFTDKVLFASPILKEAETRLEREISEWDESGK